MLIGTSLIKSQIQLTEYIYIYINKLMVNCVYNDIWQLLSLFTQIMWSSR